MALALAATPAAAPAQWYTGYGWGGWAGGAPGATPAGSVARGWGAFAEGAGDFNYRTAQAEAVQAQTWMALNEYLYRSNQARRREYAEKVAARKAAEAAKPAVAANTPGRLADEPSPADITNGNALNGLLDQLNDPAIPASVLGQAAEGLTIPGQEVSKIPFKSGQRGVIFSLNRLADDESWPAPLKEPPFQDLRDRYQADLKALQDAPEDGHITDEAIERATTSLTALYDKAKSRFQAAEFSGLDRYLRNHLGMLRMAREPEFQELLEEAAKVEEVNISNLLGFMQLYNLEFGAAKSPEEEALFSRVLYPNLKRIRDQVSEEIGGPLGEERKAAAAIAAARAEGTDPAAPAATEPPDYFQGADWDRLYGRPRTADPDAPATPVDPDAPATPAPPDRPAPPPRP
jgi:hypothetical protein